MKKRSAPIPGEVSAWGILIGEPLRGVILARCEKTNNIPANVLLDLIHTGLECERRHKGK